jgi:alkaline phosphatase
MRYFFSPVSPRTLMVCATACLGALFVLFVGCSDSSDLEEAKNVILVVGDGMGATQREAIELASEGAYGTLVMDSLPHAGLVGTNSANTDQPVTDSAAAATAMASGVKTYNGRVGVDTRNAAVPTVLERAKDAGKAVGIVTTSSVTDATPAAFAAHVDDRSQQQQIARQYLQESEPDVILGGGRRFWMLTEEEDSEDLTKRAREQGYAYLTDRSGLNSASGQRLLGLFADGAMYEDAPEGQGGSYEPAVPLREMTQKAIEVLSEDPDGFFLLVEEEAIDAMGHDGNGTLMLKAGRALDQTVEIAKNFAEENGETLLIVVGDHECCGLAIEKPEEGGKAGPGEDGPFPVADSDQMFLLDNSTSGHTAVDVPLTAMGPGAERLDGSYENTFIHEVMVQSMGLRAAVESTNTY